MGGLLNPVNGRMRAAKWGLAIHTTVMFVLVTASSVTYIDLKSISFIDKRQFPGIDGEAAPGPLGYSWLVHSDGMGIVSSVLFLSNQCLADGFLVSFGHAYSLRCSIRATPQLYRCYIVYSMDYWVITTPCLMYLTSVGMCSSLCKATVTRLANITGTATGITCVYNNTKPVYSFSPSALSTLSAYEIICLSLNVLLTLMIVARLVLHRRVQNAMGASFEASGLYKSIISMLIESCALYAGSFLLYTVTGYLKQPSDGLVAIFQPILGQTQVRADQRRNPGTLWSNCDDGQVIAPFLIILRVANRTAVTSDSISSGNPNSIHFRSQGQSTDDGGTVPNGNPTSSTGASEEAPDEVGIVVKDTIEELPLEGFSHS